MCAAFLVVVVGCTLTKSDLREGANALVPRIGTGTDGQLIVPRQCALKVAIVARPSGHAFHEALWRSADLQAIGAESRAACEANGLRAGALTGELPPDVRAVLDAPPPEQVAYSTIVLPDGDSTLIDLGAEASEIDLLLNRNGAVAGKRYKEARGYLRLSATRQGEVGVSIRAVPELHHGPVRQAWTTSPGGPTALAPQQLIMRNGQEEEAFRDLTINAELHAGQVMIVSALPDRPGGLGQWLFQQADSQGDQPIQKVLLVWASRSEEPPNVPDLTPTEPPGDVASRRPVSRQGNASTQLKK